MLSRSGNLIATTFISSTRAAISSQPANVFPQTGYVTNNPKLKREPGQRDITFNAIFNNLDILEERSREKGQIRTMKVGGQTQKWAYRSEVVGKLGLDNDHKFIWIAYGFIIIVGFFSFVYVKSQVVLNRKEEMDERQRIRRSLNLVGSDRKKIAIVDE